MVHLVTGSVNQGKTTKLIEIYNSLKNGDGFVLKKEFVNGEHIGQKIVRLSTGEGRAFSMKVCFIQNPWDEIYRFGPYSFSKNGIEFAEKIAENMVKNKIEPVFIDEIGPLELNGEGFYNLLCSILDLNLETYAAVRESCINDVIDRFKIEEYEIIRL